MRIVTMGVYGFDEASFLDALQRANVDIFIDTRRRRAVRGSRYAFANSLRLQAHLAALGIPYLHRLELAPSTEARQAQDQADTASNIRRSDRKTLTDTFMDTYSHECLAPLDSRQLVASLGPDLQSILFFCVERAPSACHRGLLANKLAADLNAKVEHIVP
jgi:uncharacterized protein (DUF488 family)